MNRLWLALALVPTVAYADPVDTGEPIPATTAAPAAAEDPPPFYVRAGVAVIKPLSTSKEMELADVDGPASLALHNGPIPGSGASVDSATVGALIVGYRLPYMHRRLSLETILGLPFTVTFKATGTLANDSIAPTALGIPTGVMPLGPDLGEAHAAPPVVTLVYSPFDGMFRPYVGAGVAVMITYGAKATNPILTEVSQPQMSIAPAPGVAAQAGVEARITQKIYARLDVKFIGLMLANATVNHIQVKTPDIPLFDTVEIGTAKMSVMVNPLIIQAGIGADF
jgi:outer membrane protein W